MFHDKAKRAQQENLPVLIAIFSTSKHRSLPITLLSQVATLSAGDTKDCRKLCKWEGGIDCSDKEHHGRRQKFSASALAIPVSALVALMGAINCHFHLATQHQRCSSILPPSTREWKKQMFSISAGNTRESIPMATMTSINCQFLPLSTKPRWCMQWKPGSTANDFNRNSSQ